jgi:uncharacterized protein (TIGR02145 family)
MDKPNVFKSSKFHADAGDVIHIILKEEVGTVITFALVDSDIPKAPLKPTAKEPTSITATGFTLNWYYNQNTTAFYLDISTDPTFATFVAGYNNKSMGDNITEVVAGLSSFITYYYRIRAYNQFGTSVNSDVYSVITLMSSVVDGDGNNYTYVTIGTQQWLVENLKTTKYIDGTAIPNLTLSDYNDWFLPSKDELNEMYIALHLFGVGGFINNIYVTSSEENATYVLTQNFLTGAQNDATKNIGTPTGSFRACRSFTSVTNYNLRDIGQAGGLIFWKSGNDYLEAAPTDLVMGSTAWSNVVNIEIGITAQGTAIGTGQANTTAIIGQVGHIDSAAKLCDNLSMGGWVNDTTGAYCWYNNDIANKTPYGALYNWYAVDNAHGIAPIGWRVPSVADWSTLSTFAGGGALAGGKLKQSGTSYWDTPNRGAIDSYGFGLLPSGYRNEGDGLFYSLHRDTYLHSTDDENSAFRANYDATDLDGNYGEAKMGYSIRCMRDIP